MCAALWINVRPRFQEVSRKRGREVPVNSRLAQNYLERTSVRGISD